MASAEPIGDIVARLVHELAETRVRLEEQEHEIAELRSQVASASAAIWAYGDVAGFLNVSRRKVEELVSENRIPHFRIGSCVRFHRRAVEEWTKRGGRKPGTPRFYSKRHAPGMPAEESDRKTEFPLTN